MFRPKAAMRSPFSWVLMTWRLITTSTMAAPRTAQIPYSQAFLKTVTPFPSTKHSGKISHANIERAASTASAPTAANATAPGMVFRRHARSAKQSVTNAWSARAEIQSLVVSSCVAGITLMPW